MPHVLLAGIVVSPPKVNNFPSSGLPRATVTTRVDDMIYSVPGSKRAPCTSNPSRSAMR
ncbi:MAG: hypothetical protein USCAAHI_02372 [Beijerinckiaceae bacterium]|nr:MAG: hypothetical protein USCAAHI_02372 [Beijerinckiaceae bacterium]